MSSTARLHLYHSCTADIPICWRVVGLHTPRGTLVADLVVVQFHEKEQKFLRIEFGQIEEEETSLSISSRGLGGCHIR
jgi:hypothetical protein